MFWGQVHDEVRGRVVKVFTKDKPDNKGNYNYGFLQMIDEGGRPVVCKDGIREPELWFNNWGGDHIDASNVPGELCWIRIDSRFDELRMPSIGEILVFQKVPPNRQRGKKPEASPWTHESDYNRSRINADMRGYRILDMVKGNIWEGRYSSKHDVFQPYVGASQLPNELSPTMILQTNLRDDPIHYFAAMHMRDYWQEVDDPDIMFNALSGAMART